MAATADTDAPLTRRRVAAARRVERPVQGIAERWGADSLDARVRRPK
jgi:hypothetical protein